MSFVGALGHAIWFEIREKGFTTGFDGFTEYPMTEPTVVTANVKWRLIGFLKHFLNYIGSDLSVWGKVILDWQILF